MKQLLTPTISFESALGIAVAAHIVLLIGFSISAPNNTSANSIGVTISISSQAKAPEDAKFIAATNQLGSGNLDQSATPTTTDRAEYSSDVASDVFKSKQRQQQVDSLSQVVTTRADSDRSSDSESVKSEQTQTQSGTDNQEQLTAEAIKTLEAQLALEIQAYAQRPRVHRLTSVTAKGAVEAEYQRQWQEKVELVGNANYPQSAIAQKLSGDVRLLVAINSKGGIESIKLLQSSGHPSLDQSAIASVKLAAPFATFPIELMRQADILEMIRTWQFRNNIMITTGAL